MLNISVNRNKFLKAISIVEKAISENKIRPILSGIFLEAKEDKIVLKGTNMEINIQSQIFGKINNQGEIVFPYQLVNDYLKEIEDEEIQLVELDEILLIESENSTSEFTIYDASEYPRISGNIQGVENELSKHLLIDMLEKVKFASATNTDSPEISCVKLELENDKLRMVATDTYRLVYVEEKVEDITSNISISIPLYSVEALIKILKNVGDDFVKFTYSGNQISFEIEKIFFMTRVIDLAFPDYKGILENMIYDKKVLIETEPFISTLKRVQVFVKNNNESKNSALFNLQGEEFIITGVSDTAKIKEEIKIAKDGEDIKLSLNVKFLLEYLLNTDKDKKTSFEMSNSNGAVLIKSESNDKYLYILMPLALIED